MRRASVALALVTCVLTAGCTKGNSSVSAQAQQGAGGGGGGGRGGGGQVPVTAAKAVQKSMPLELRAIGAVEPSQTVSIHAQITGQLTSVGFKEGDDVKQGAVLFTLDRRPLEAALKQAEANLQRDTAQGANAKQQASRLQDLAARGIATRDQADTARAQSDALDATIEADRAAIDNARIQLQYATITAPISGRTGTLMVHEGNLVRANDTTPLIVINQLSPANVSFAVPEAQLAALKRFMAQGAVSVEASPPNDTAAAAKGKVTFVDNSVDATTGTIKVKGSFANLDHRLWPGQYVNVVMTLATDKDVIVVPTTAIQNGQDGQYVFVIKNNQTAELRPIKVRRSAGVETILSSGVEANETVVTDGQLRLVPGSRVTIKGDAQRGAAGE